MTRRVRQALVPGLAAGLVLVGALAAGVLDDPPAEPPTDVGGSPWQAPAVTGDSSPTADPGSPSGGAAGSVDPIPPPDTVTPVPDPSSDPPVPEFPADGPGTFRYATGESPVRGEAGTLRRYRVAVEDGVPVDPDEFAAVVDATLADGRGWTAGGQWRFQRVPQDGSYHFTVLLATSRTTARLCAAGGLWVDAPALPEGGVSCQTGGQVIINLHRWMLSVPHYVEIGEPLLHYRQMLLNHEIGHALGHGHEACPGQGRPAPVMQQQTISLQGCTPYAWPYRDGARYTGPPTQ